MTEAVQARDALTRRTDELAAQLESARASGAVAGGRDRADLDYLFVVTYGRSGSTLLQGILNTIPGVLIRGENGGVLTDLYRFHATAHGNRERLARPGPLPETHSWWGIDGYRDETALRGLRTLMLETVLRPAPDTKVAGFKEIDWLRDDLPGGLPGLLAFAREVFPDARFVLNTRDLHDVARSKWWARRPDAFGELRSIEQAYVDALTPLGDALFYRVQYDDYLDKPSTLRGLFDWLGAEFDEDRVRAVLDVRHSY